MLLDGGFLWTTVWQEAYAVVSDPQAKERPR